MAQYLLGIDNGNTVSKAALFDLKGREVAVASSKVETEYPHPGWTERNMDVMWQSTAAAIREVIAKSGVKPAMACICWINKESPCGTESNPWIPAPPMC